MQLPTFEETIRHFIDDYTKGLPEQILAYSAPASPRYISYGCQSINQDDIDEVSSTLRSAYLTQGPKVAEFERGISHVTQSQYTIVTNSATSALHIACLVSGIQVGDEIITSPITFVASANCALYCGAMPTFADIDPRTYTIDPDEIAKKITAKTRAIISVHLAGQSCDMKKIQKVVREAEKKFNTRIFIIEDASHSIGSLYNGKPVGSCEFSDMAVFSFHPVKHITTGEGGAICTNDEQLAKKLYRLRSHGITSNSEEFVYQDAAFSATSDGKKVKNPWYYEQIDLGYNYRLTDMQAALGVSQLDRLTAFQSRRKEIIRQYNNAFRTIQTLTIPFQSPDCDTNFHLYILLWDFDAIRKTRAQVMGALREKGIQTQVHYIPVHVQPYYQEHLGTRWGQHPKAEEYYQQCLSLPLHPSMSGADVERVIKSVKELSI
ncbi:UDP-4-amino-4,6-dideoxy-N-acetyl-beta-L-altrosamine transaminase [Candidatus Uhrbacteria bacterium]|nr:UDP-4-amino-4,6-dideoxy-N-acetyl-beta-L-altrosamine transaminase [Candidatus Uhrbacteria bacterium]